MQCTIACMMTSRGWKSLETLCSADMSQRQAFGDYSSYVAELENGAVDINERVLGMPVSVSPLHKSIKEFNRAVIKVDSELKVLLTWKVWSPWRNNPMRVRDLNDRLMMTERAFTDREGLFGRPWYKHMIYTPSLYNDYGAQVYPGADDAIQTAKRTNTSESWQSVQHEIHRIARVINQSALVLSGGVNMIVLALLIQSTTVRFVKIFTP